MQHPKMFTASWVSNQDAHFQALMLSEIFDLAIVEHWVYDGTFDGALTTKQDVIRRLEYAKLAGYIDRTIVMYAQICPKGEEHPHGLAVDGVCSLISELQDEFPEMPGLNFYGCGGANATSAMHEDLIKGINKCALKLYPDGYTGIKTDDDASIITTSSQLHVFSRTWAGAEDKTDLFVPHELCPGVAPGSSAARTDRWTYPFQTHSTAPTAISAERLERLTPTCF